VPSEDDIAFYTEFWSITIRLASVVVGLVHALFCCIWNAVMHKGWTPWAEIWLVYAVFAALADMLFCRYIAQRRAVPIAAESA